MKLKYSLISGMSYPVIESPEERAEKRRFRGMLFFTVVFTVAVALSF